MVMSERRNNGKNLDDIRENIMRMENKPSNYKGGRNLNDVQIIDTTELASAL